VEELHKYLQKKTREVSEVEKTIKSSIDFNHRQLALLSDALRNQDRRYTFVSHATSHNVTHETSRRDLLALEGRGLLERRRGGRRAIFTVPRDLSERLKKAA